MTERQVEKGEKGARIETPNWIICQSVFISSDNGRLAYRINTNKPAMNEYSWGQQTTCDVLQKFDSDQSATMIEKRVNETD